MNNINNSDNGDNPSLHGDFVTTSWLTLSQGCGKVENDSCGDVSFRRCSNVVVPRCHNVATTSLQH